LFYYKKVICYIFGYSREDDLIDDIIVSIEAGDCGACEEAENVDVVVLRGKLNSKDHKIQKI
jgi:hypothetical protein